MKDYIKHYKYNRIIKAIITLITVIVYRFVLDINYAEVIQPIFGYRGFSLTYSIFSNHNLYSYLMVIVLIPLMISILNNKSSFVASFVWFIFLFRYVPNTSLIGLTDCDFYFIILQFIFMACILISISFITNKKENIDYKLIIDYKLLGKIVIICSIIIILISGVYVGFRINFSFDNVYALRDEIRNTNIPTFVSYLWGPIGNILPIAFVLYLIKKNMKMCAFVAFIIFLNFSIDGMKSTVFKLFLALLFFSFNKKNLLQKFSVTIIVLVILATLEPLYFKTFGISNFLTYRMIYVPCILDNSFFDYITKFGPLFYTQRSEINFIIGALYFNAPEMRANNGLFTDAYMNLGYIGIVVYPIVYAYLLKISDKVMCKINDNLVIFVAFIIFYLVNSTSLSTALVSHGIIITIVLIYYITKKTKSTINEDSILKR